MKGAAALLLMLWATCAHAQPTYLGSFDVGAIVRCPWNTYDVATGAGITRSTNGTVTVYEDFDAAVEITTGATDTEDYDGETGAHLAVLDTDSGNGYEAGKEYGVLVKDVTAGGVAFSPWLCTFSLNTGDPLAADLVAVNGDVTAAPKAETFFDASPVAQSGNVYPLVDTEIGAIGTVTSDTNSDTDFLVAAVGTVQNLGSGATLANNNADLAAAITALPVGLRDLLIEDQGGGVSLGCAIAVVLAYAAGDLVTAGADSTYEDPSGTETRATGTVTSAGNRTAAITCPTY